MSKFSINDTLNDDVTVISAKHNIFANIKLSKSVIFFFQKCNTYSIFTTKKRIYGR